MGSENSKYWLIRFIGALEGTDSPFIYAVVLVGILISMLGPLAFYFNNRSVCSGCIL